MRLRLLVLFVAAALFTGVGTTTASAVRCTYDAPASARVDAHAGGAAGVSAALLGEAREGPAACPFDAGDASTTPSLAFIATKGAAGVADDAATVFRKDTSHIFRDARGHLPTDTPGNRQLIKSAVDPANLRSTTRLPDGSTLTKYFKTLPDGTQVWAEVRNGTTITNGGLNATPR